MWLLRSRRGSCSRPLPLDPGPTAGGGATTPSNGARTAGVRRLVISRSVPEPHSTKAIEDGVGWALETDGETLVARPTANRSPSRSRGTACAGGQPAVPRAGRLRRERQNHPAARRSRARSVHLGELGRFRLRPLPPRRKAVTFNLAMREFCEEAFGRPRTPRDPTVYRPDGRPRALFVSSPIGLGHAQRDVAIARELRRLHPDLQIDWLAQDPVTRVLQAEGERIHPASAHLANESRAHRVGVGRARPALLSRAAAHGRDPGCELHDLPRRRARGAL